MFIGFAFGYMGPPQSGPAPSVIAPELVDAFNEGRLAGEQAAVDGLPSGPECIDTSIEASPAAEGVVTSCAQAAEWSRCPMSPDMPEPCGGWDRARLVV